MALRSVVSVSSHEFVKRAVAGESLLAGEFQPPAAIRPAACPGDKDRLPRRLHGEILQRHGRKSGLRKRAARTFHVPQAHIAVHPCLEPGADEPAALPAEREVFDAEPPTSMRVGSRKASG